MLRWLSGDALFDLILNRHSWDFFDTGPLSDYVFVTLHQSLSQNLPCRSKLLDTWTHDEVQVAHWKLRRNSIIFFNNFHPFNRREMRHDAIAKPIKDFERRSLSTRRTTIHSSTAPFEIPYTERKSVVTRKWAIVTIHLRYNCCIYGTKLY